MNISSNIIFLYFPTLHETVYILYISSHLNMIVRTYVKYDCLIGKCFTPYRQYFSHKTAKPTSYSCQIPMTIVPWLSGLETSVIRQNMSVLRIEPQKTERGHVSQQQWHDKEWTLYTLALGLNFAVVTSPFECTIFERGVKNLQRTTNKLKWVITFIFCSR